MRSFSILLCGIAALTACVSCGTRSSKKAAPVTQNPTTVAAEVESCLTAVDNYFTGTIAKEYSPGQVSLQYNDYLSVDESNPEDILVFGNFWVENYNVSGDTLLFVSGGNHAGKLHVKEDAEGHFSVTSFEPVGDGSTFLPSAKAIFGDRFEDFFQAYSNHDKREAVRKDAIAAFVTRKGIPVKVYKDYGWPAVTIPKADATK